MHVWYDRLLPVSSDGASAADGAEAAKAGADNLEVDSSTKRKKVCVCVCVCCFSISRGRPPPRPWVGPWGRLGDGVFFHPGMLCTPGAWLCSREGRHHEHSVLALMLLLCSRLALDGHQRPLRSSNEYQYTIL